jgi:hypothetical protein
MKFSSEIAPDHSFCWGARFLGKGELAVSTKIDSCVREGFFRFVPIVAF